MQVEDLLFRLAALKQYIDLSLHYPERLALLPATDIAACHMSQNSDRGARL